MGSGSRVHPSIPVSSSSSLLGTNGQAGSGVMRSSGTWKRSMPAATCIITHRGSVVVVVEEGQ